MSDLDVMSGPELCQWCGADALRWAKAFNNFAVKAGYAEIEEAFLTAWFANAIMHSHDVMTGAGPINGDHAQWLIDREGKP